MSLAGASPTAAAFPSAQLPGIAGLLVHYLVAYYVALSVRSVCCTFGGYAHFTIAFYVAISVRSVSVSVMGDEWPVRPLTRFPTASEGNPGASGNRGTAGIATGGGQKVPTAAVAFSASDRSSVQALAVGERRRVAVVVGELTYRRGRHYGEEGLQFWSQLVPD